MDQRSATKEDVTRIIKHIIIIDKLHSLGFHETRLFIYQREDME